MTDLVERARAYLAANAAESGADVLIAELADELDGLRGAVEVPVTVYKAVERVLDEHSAWIARPNPEVTKAVALAAGIAFYIANEGKWENLAAAQAVVDQQAGDDSLWFVPETLEEDIFQKALRRLHAAVEGKTPEECAGLALTGGERHDL